MKGISRPARYVGIEINPYGKKLGDRFLKVALAFPEVYELGMSHYGFLLLHNMLMDKGKYFVDRIFAPWSDMEDKIRTEGEVLRSIETATMLNEFHVVAFSLAYELSLTNALNMLDLGGIPLRSIDRSEGDPIIIAGGALSGNPEPFSIFFDAIFIGEAEEGLFEMLEAIEAGRIKGDSRDSILSSLARLESVYVPGLYDPSYDSDGNLLGYTTKDGSFPSVKRRILGDLNDYPLPSKNIIPGMRVVHDRLGIEIARGCTRGCRFCQAGYYYRPVRERDGNSILDYLDERGKSSGFDEVGFLSLSSSDYSCINDLLGCAMDNLEDERISISLPSLRINSISEELVKEMKKVRKSGFTIAPEAGSNRLRKVINKEISDEEVLASAEWIFKNGWNSVKMYFMIGLPGEGEEDLASIIELVRKVAGVARKKGKKKQINLSISTFVPKPHTPFQWAPQISVEEMEYRIGLIRKGFSKEKRVTVKWHSPHMSFLEGVLSRGDRKAGELIEKAFILGARHDGWSDRLDMELWEKAIEELHVDVEKYSGAKDLDGFLPWDFIDMGIKKGFLVKEYYKSLQYEATEDCKTGSCSACGVCHGDIIKNRVSPEIVTRAGTGSGEGPGDERASFIVAYRKVGGAAYLSALELQSLFSRAVRISGIPVRYSQGFNPRPRISFPSALPVGVSSSCEFFFISLRDWMEPGDIVSRLSSCLPSELSPFYAAHEKVKISTLLFRESFDIEFAISGLKQEDIFFIEKKLLAIPEIVKVEHNQSAIMVISESHAGKSLVKSINEAFLSCEIDPSEIQITKSSADLYMEEGDERRKIHSHKQQAI